MGSIVHGANFPMTTTEQRKAEVVLEHAKDFLDQYFTSIRRLVVRGRRKVGKQLFTSIQTILFIQIDFN